MTAATGAVRWSLRLPAQGLLGAQAATADGGLAMVVSRGVLQVVNLADGRVRWQRRIPASPALAAADGLVIYGLNGRLTGYDDRTGRPRWTASGLPQQPATQLAGGLVLVTSNLQGGAARTALTAVIPATGRMAWRFNPGTPVASGRLAWRVDMPTFVQSPPVLVPGGILVQPGDLIYACADRTLRTGAGNTTAGPA